MKKTALVLSIIATLVSCGGAAQKEVDSTVAVDAASVAIDSVGIN